jgi:hypothetical protein
MDFASVNWLAVLACVVVSMIVGSVWYHPKTFFPVWWKGIGKSDKDQPGAGSNMGLTWGLTILSSLVQAVAMAFMVKSVGGLMPGGVNAVNGVATGFMLWLGFIAPTYLVNKLFAGHSLKIWAIEVGNHLVDFVLFGLILGAWR